ncbi:MAG: DNA polymerase/3'-5' exonuclease PolX [Candidatus Methylarchaceae archaeon HK02M1]|nr:DNA polymerase/3'-5' exonuclease PolX [Candidatus Methylarchaceae archaeon HK02M1]
MSNIENRVIAAIFYEMADLLEIKGVPFKPRAYRRAAQTIETLPDDIKLIYKKDELQKIPGIGSSLASKIQEIIETGSLASLEELREELPQGLRELIEIEGLGPKSALKLNKKLKISSIDELESAARQGKIRELEGFGKKSEENILLSIEMYRSAQERFLLGYALPIAKEIEKKLNESKVVGRISLAGSIRRRKETVGDLDILATSDEPSKTMNFFTQLSEIKRVLAKGKTKSTVVLTNNLQVDLRVVEEESFGSAFQYFTGSKEHNIRLRELALDKDWKLSEYGLFDKKTNKKIAGEKEKGIYEALGLEYIEPELRENRGEIESALKGKLPYLIEYGDVKGDLHVHTVWTDGSYSIEDMAEAAKTLGYEYMAICDHSKTLQIAHGLDEEDLRKQIKEIEKLNRRIDGLTLLSGIEVNIDSNGKLDIKDVVLKDLDVVVASVHSGFKQPEKKMTERVLTAMHNDYVNVIGHPTGRIINKREPYQIDLPKIFEAATELGVFMEINAFPNRLDLSDSNCFKSRDYGTKVSIGTDAHHKDHLRYMELGVATARRGWLEKKDVINTLDLRKLKKLLES